MSKIQSRKWLESLDQLYNPAQFTSQGMVLLLDGHVNDLFLDNALQPAVPLPQLLLARFRRAVDAFAWYQVSGESGTLQYEFNRFPTGNVIQSTSARPPATSGVLADLEQALNSDRWDWQQRHEGRASRTCVPQEAIHEIDRLLNTPTTTQRAIIVFQDVFWAIQEDAVLGKLRTWPDLCLARHHLVVFALGRDDLTWIRVCFGQERMGVKRLSVDGPPAEEVKAYLIQRCLKSGREFFAWQSLDEVAAHLAKNVAARPGEGFRSLVLVHVPGFEKQAQDMAERGAPILDKTWLAAQPKVGHKAEEVHLDDVVLKPAERAFFEKILLPALQDPQWRHKQAKRLRVSEDRIPVPTRILLYGPPGTGKTTIGKMIATESRMPFFSVKADDFQSTLRGGPLEKVARHFAEWRRNSPCVVFWDEVESIAADRARSQHEDNPITQILAELESTAGRDKNIIIVCATNCPELLDPAFRDRFRGGEFLIGYPDQAGRERLVNMCFQVHLLEDGLTPTVLAQMFENRSPREIMYCADSCMRQLTTGDETVITQQMVHRWLIASPVDQRTVQRWKEEETKRQQQLQELGIAQV